MKRGGQTPWDVTLPPTGTFDAALQCCAAWVTDKGLEVLRERHIASPQGCGAGGGRLLHSPSHRPLLLSLVRGGGSQCARGHKPQAQRLQRICAVGVAHVTVVHCVPEPAQFHPRYQGNEVAMCRLPRQATPRYGVCARCAEACAGVWCAWPRWDIVYGRKAQGRAMLYAIYVY